MVWIWLGLLACGGGDDGGGETADGCLPGPDPTLEIGTGVQAFEPMPSEVELVHGPQGGYHVVVSFDAAYLDSSGVIAATVEGTIEDEVVAVSEPFLELRCNPDTGTLQAWNILLIYPLTPAELDNQPTTISASLTDEAGGSASA